MAAFQIWNLEYSTGILSFQLCMGRAQSIEEPVYFARQNGRWACVYTNLISTLKMLLFVCTVGELDFSHY